MNDRLTIDRLGHLGDGVTGAGDDAVYVRGALPGEQVRVRRNDHRAELLEVMVPSRDRQAPLCRHFLTCGGCALQHLEAGAYLEWKRGLVASALAARGIDARVDPTVPVPPHSRRRATFTARRTRSSVVVGFHGFRSGEIVALSECPVLDPVIEGVLPALPVLAAGRLSRRGEARIQLTVSAAGLDVAVDGGRAPEGAGELAALAQVAERLDLARLTWNGETVVERRAPIQYFGGIPVVPPGNAFLQAAPPAEAALVRLVLEGVGNASSIADLFSGVGTFSLPLARRAAVHAVEGEADPLAALEAGARTIPDLRPVTVERRDLFRRPLAVAELARFDAVVFDPPRAGAKAQAAELAAALVPVVVAVSCNPATFARDARILIDGGYRLDRVSPIDQFLFSPHVELVAVLRRGSASR